MLGLLLGSVAALQVGDRIQPLLIGVVFLRLLLLLEYLVRQPIQALVESLTSQRATTLDLPAVMLDLTQTVRVCQFCGVLRPG